MIGQQVRQTFPEVVRAEPASAQSLTYNTVTSVAYGLRQLPPKARLTVETDVSQLRSVLAKHGIPLAASPEPFVLEAAQRVNTLSTKSAYAMAIAVVAVSLISLFFAYRAIGPRFHARNRVERAVLVALLAASSLAVLTTVGIVLSMLSESLRFFSQVSAEAPHDIILGALIGGIGENLVCRAFLNHMAEMKHRRALRNAGGLLHGMRDHHDCIVSGQFADQLLHTRRGNRIKR